jgi:hypothetical protein
MENKKWNLENSVFFLSQRFHVLKFLVPVFRFTSKAAAK